jgi:hypothetical protein
MEDGRVKCSLLYVGCDASARGGLESRKVLNGEGKGRARHGCTCSRRRQRANTGQGGPEVPDNLALACVNLAP